MCITAVDAAKILVTFLHGDPREIIIFACTGATCAHRCYELTKSKISQNMDITMIAFYNLGYRLIVELYICERYLGFYINMQVVTNDLPSV